MKKKIIFLIVFVPVHILLTMHLMQWYLFNYDADAHGLLGGLLHVLAIVCSLPVLLPLIISGWEEHWPWLLQMMPFIANSLLWGIAILAISGGIRRLRGKAKRVQTLHPAG
jgi:hypothetical protein